MLLHCCLKSKINSQANCSFCCRYSPSYPFSVQFSSVAQQSKFSFRQNIFIPPYQSISIYYPKSQGYKILLREFIVRRRLLAFTPSESRLQAVAVKIKDPLHPPAGGGHIQPNSASKGPQSLPCCSVAGFLDNFLNNRHLTQTFQCPIIRKFLIHKTILMPYKRMQQVRSLPWNANLSKGLN